MREPRDHARRHRRPITYNPTSRRLRELERIIAARHGSALDTDDADTYLEPVAQTLRRIYENKNGFATTAHVLDRLQVWAEVRTPQVSTGMLQEAAREAMQRPRMDTADVLAVRLNLTYAERTRLQITTIGACDLNKAGRIRKRKERKRARDRARAAAKRKERGVVARTIYLAQSLTRARPWEAKGISRRTYYRQLARAIGTSPSPSNLLSGGRPTCATGQTQPSRPSGDPLVAGSS